MKNLLLILAVLLTNQFSCSDAPVVFDRPQPEDLDVNNYFQPIYRGTFFCDSDSSMVHVHAQTIFKEKKYAFKLSLEDIADDPNLTYEREMIFIKNHPEPYVAELNGDTVLSEVLLRDTLFQISENHVLKHFRGHHILNKKISDTRWQVEVISLVGDLDLRYARAEMPEDLEALEKITPVKKENEESRRPQIMIAPTVLEFSEILQQELIFNDCDYFIRQAMPTSI